MIKIKIEAASGADLRAQLIALLVDAQNVSTPANASVRERGEAITHLPETSEAPAPAMEIVKTEEKVVTKRLTKAQQDKLKADAEAAKNAEATSTDDTPAVEEEVPEVKVTLDVLREMVLRLSRQGKKDDVKAVIINMGVERITEFKEEQYQAFFDSIKPMYDALPPEA